MRTRFHWPNLDAFPIETFRYLQLAALSIRHSGIEDIIIVLGTELSSPAQVVGGLGESLSVHQVETVVNIHIWLRRTEELGTEEPGLRLLVS